MRYWPTFLMAVVLAGLGLYLYVIELPQKESSERQDRAGKKVLLFDQQTLSGLTVKTDRHELGLFPVATWRKAFRVAGFHIRHAGRDSSTPEDDVQWFAGWKPA